MVTAVTDVWLIVLFDMVSLIVDARLSQGRYSFRKKEREHMLALLQSLHREESGQDLIEYALVGLIIALGAIAGMGTVASSINAEFTKISAQLT